ncbi:MAG: alpha-L-glutamate ligase [Gammaproteobacteria bacterium]|nr:alpha-L-glutamate ligase [Gammaproteobacteria bacterium]
MVRPNESTGHTQRNNSLQAKIHVIHENNDWTQHLQHRLEELELPHELWHLDIGQLDLFGKPPPGVFYNRISASSHTRDHRYAPEFTQGVLAWLEHNGCTVVNGSRALSLEISKVSQYLALNQHGIQTPITFSAVGKQQVMEAAKRLDMDSFITKHNRAGKGQGVKLFHSLPALEAYLEGPDYEHPVDGITLIQQYIDSPGAHIIRHEFIDGKFFYAVRVDTSEGFELCPADACSIDDAFCPADSAESGTKPKFEILTDYQSADIARYESFLSDNQVQVAGIESVQDTSGNTYTYDVNTNTNYNSDAEAAAEKYGMLELARYLGRLLNQSQG